MTRFLCRILGFFFLLIGFIGVLTPIPFGLVFIFIAMLFLIPTTPSFANMVRRTRTKSRMVNKAFDSMTRRAPSPYKRVLRETEPTDFDRP